MPRKKSPPIRKPKSFRCKHPGCRFKAMGPSKLGQHYEKNPTHATKRSRHGGRNTGMPLPTIARSRRSEPSLLRELKAKRKALDDAIAALEAIR